MWAWTSLSFYGGLIDQRSLIEMNWGTFTTSSSETGDTIFIDIFILLTVVDLNCHLHPPGPNYYYYCFYLCLFQGF